MTPISAVIITYNEARNIGRCLESLQGIVEEILVVDSSSTDETVEIASRYGARVIQHAFEGHVEQKNFAAGAATYDWVLSLDADECLDKTLQASVLEAKKQMHAEGYSMNRLTNYCGQWIRHCGWYPDVKLRLWDRRGGAWGGDNPHDRYILNRKDARVIHLKGDLLHYSYYTIEEHEERSKRYALISAEAMMKRGARIPYPMIYVKYLMKFLRNYVLHLGFLDGKNGFTICRITAYETLLKYQLLYKMQKKA